ncbi:hypothetical protein FHG87_008698 [Trinorchestia longiramus]|nr:hypothetical protein FHG87_008698 [Trinorchestia longiramus]
MQLGWCVVLVTLLLSSDVQAQLSENGQCPHYVASSLFTPLVMLDMINVGEMRLSMSLGSSLDRSHSCQALQFVDGKQYRYTFKDRYDRDQVIEGAYQARFPSFISTSHLKLMNGANNVLAADSRGTSILVPLAYGHGIVIFVSCSEMLWFHNQQFYLFVDTDINLEPDDLKEIEKTLKSVGIIPESLELDRPDQSCREKEAGHRSLMSELRKK